VGKNLQNDKKEGKFTEWYENGQKDLEGTYKDGNLKFGKTWDKNGNLTEETK